MSSVPDANDRSRTKYFRYVDEIWCFKIIMVVKNKPYLAGLRQKTTQSLKNPAFCKKKQGFRLLLSVGLNCRSVGDRGWRFRRFRAPFLPTRWP